MTAPALWYAKSEENAFKGNIKIGTNPVNVGLLASTYTPNLLTDALWSDISAHESSASSGYSAGGVAVGSPSVSTVAANSWVESAVVSTAYIAGQVVIPASANSYLYRCEASGTSGSSAPAWPTTFQQSITDGTVTWTNIGTSITQFTCDPITFSGLTCSDFRYLAFYDSVTGYLICLHDLGSGQNVDNSDVIYTPDQVGFAYSFAA